MFYLELESKIIFLTKIVTHNYSFSKETINGAAFSSAHLPKREVLLEGGDLMRKILSFSNLAK